MQLPLFQLAKAVKKGIDEHGIEVTRENHEKSDNGAGREPPVLLPPDDQDVEPEQRRCGNEQADEGAFAVIGKPARRCPGGKAEAVLNGMTSIERKGQPHKELEQQKCGDITRGGGQGGARRRLKIAQRGESDAGENDQGK